MIPTLDPDAKPLRAILRMLMVRRSSAWSLPGSPRAIVLLWLGAALIVGLIGLIDAAPVYYAGQQFALSAAMAFAALAVTAVFNRRGNPLRLAFGFIAIGLTATIARILVGRIPIAQFDLALWADVVVIAWSVAAAGRLAQSAGGWATQRARIAANLIIAAVFLLAFKWDTVESASMAALQERNATPAYKPINPEALWTAQPRLLADSLKPLETASKRSPSAYIIVIAAGGSQQLFGREVNAVLTELKGKYGSGSPSILFSNARKDLLVHPLASRSNLRGAVSAIGHRYDPKRDVVIFYLASHGGRNAALSTDLPDYTDLAPISADFLAKELDKAGITRRVVIVSACYSGAWIRPLASPDTIVLTASAADRTSFGCDDSRKYTVFGQAVIESSLHRGESLRDAFGELKRHVTSEEAATGVTPSLPQAYIGSRMGALWETTGTSLPTGADDCPVPRSDTPRAASLFSPN